jgi:excisionase family DNA binding protein
MKIYGDPNFRPPAPPLSNQPEIMTIKEVAEYLRIGERSAYKLAKNGDLPSFKVVNKWRFDRELIQAMVRQKSLDEK